MPRWLHIVLQVLSTAAGAYISYKTGSPLPSVIATGVSGVTGVITEQHQLTTANPALSGAGTIGGSGNLQIAVGYMKNANAFAASSGWTVVYMDKCASGQDHFVVAYKIVSGADHGSFSNPLGYEMAVTTLNLT